MKKEVHYVNRVGWLRAAVLGANDGIISTSSLVIGIAAANGERMPIVLAAVAGMTAGAFSMAAGEYVSVSSQADTEKADLAREQHALDTMSDIELKELSDIYVKRGLDEADLYLCRRRKCPCPSPEPSRRGHPRRARRWASRCPPPALASHSPCRRRDSPTRSAPIPTRLSA